MAIRTPSRHSETPMLRVVSIVRRRLRQQFFRISGKCRSTGHPFRVRQAGYTEYARKSYIVPAFNLSIRLNLIVSPWSAALFLKVCGSWGLEDDREHAALSRSPN